MLLRLRFDGAWDGMTKTAKFTDARGEGGVTTEIELLTQNADGMRYDQTFLFPMIPDGTYKLAIMKPGKYVPNIVPVTVSGGAAVLGKVKLWLYGDVNYDGTVNSTDATTVLQAFVSGVVLGEAEESADVNLDGTFNSTDATEILIYFVTGSSVAFDQLP